VRFNPKELLSRKRRVPVTPFLTAGIVASLVALSLFFWGSYRLDRRQARAQSQKLREVSQKVVEVQQSARQKQADLQKILNEGTLPIGNGDLTREREIPHFLRAIISLSSDLGVKVVGFKTNSAPRKTGGPALSKADGLVVENKDSPVRSFDLRFRGRFGDLMNLVSLLERASKPMTIENLTISLEGVDGVEGGQVAMQFTLNVLEVSEGEVSGSRRDSASTARVNLPASIIAVRDPFRFGASPSASRENREDGVFRLSAILKTPKGPIAIIGREVVGVGERVGNLVVVGISGSQVQLRGGGKRVTLDWKAAE